MQQRGSSPGINGRYLPGTYVSRIFKLLFYLFLILVDKELTEEMYYSICVQILIRKICASIFCKIENCDDFQGGWILLQATVTFSHLADAFIQSDLHMCDLQCIHI